MFGATVEVHTCMSNAVACQLKTITIQPSFANTAVNMQKLTLKKYLKLVLHTQSRNPRNHSTFRRIFKTDNENRLLKIYNEIVYRKPILFTIGRNKVRFTLDDVMNIMFSKTPKDGPQVERAMICTMILPHFLLARYKSENDGKMSNALKCLSV